MNDHESVMDRDWSTIYGLIPFNTSQTFPKHFHRHFHRHRRRCMDMALTRRNLVTVGVLPNSNILHSKFEIVLEQTVRILSDILTNRPTLQRHIQVTKYQREGRKVNGPWKYTTIGENHTVFSGVKTVDYSLKVRLLTVHGPYTSRRAIKDKVKTYCWENIPGFWLTTIEW